MACALSPVPSVRLNNETTKHFCLTLKVPSNSLLTFNAARGSEDAMKELAGKSSLQAVVDAALAACAAQHAAAKTLCE